MIEREKIQQALLKNKYLADTQYAQTVSRENEWSVYDSDLEQIASSFLGVLPLEDKLTNVKYRFKSYIERTLSKDLGQRQSKNLTAVEFGGPGSRLFKGFTKGFFSKTVGVCLQDMRKPQQKETDSKNGHSIIPGDILDIKDGGSLFKKIREQLGATKVNLIISRMLGPLVLIDKNLSIFDRIIRDWYYLLEENGVMFIETGLENKLESEKEKMEKWKEVITTKFPQIAIQTNDEFSVVRLHKGAGSPEHLPAAIKILRNK